MLSHCLRCLLFLTLQRRAVNEEGKLDKVSKGRSEVALMDGVGYGRSIQAGAKDEVPLFCTISRYLWTFLLSYLIRRW